MLTEFDYIVFAIFAFFTIRGFFYGFISQVSSLTGWFLAIWLTNSYSGTLSNYIPDNWLGGFFTQKALSIIIIFTVTLLIFSCFGMLMRRLIYVANLRRVDSMFGFMFGAARGVLVILVVFILGHLTPLTKYPFWYNSFSRPVVESVLFSLRPHFPKFLNDLVSITLNSDASRN